MVVKVLILTFDISFSLSLTSVLNIYVHDCAFCCSLLLVHFLRIYAMSPASFIRGAVIVFFQL